MTNTSNPVKETGILFSGPMVRALLDGSKTQTRRVFKPDNIRVESIEPSGFHYSTHKRDGSVTGSGPFIPADWLHYCPYGQPGDRLWVREAHHRTTDGGPVLLGYQESGENREFEQFGVHVREFRHHLGGWGGRTSKNFPSIHMPRWASRILLEVVSVRVERLNDISEADARAEGITDGGCVNCGDPEPCGCPNPSPDARDTFIHLWESINGPGSWGANPWVWVISVRRITP